MESMMRKDLRKLVPYRPHENKCPVKLDANESPYNLSEITLDHFISYVKEEFEANRYPDTNCDELRGLVADIYQVSVDEIIVGVGSDQLIDYICRAFLEVGDKVLMPSPSFSMYRLTTLINHGVPMEYPLDQDFQYSKEVLLKAIEEEHPKVTILCSPNNPTGSAVSKAFVKEIAMSTSGVVLMDDAYGEFCDTEYMELISECDNLIVLKTLSKAMGLASMRIGLGFGNQQLIECLYKVKAPYNINTLSEKLAIVTLRDMKNKQSEVKVIREERNRLRKKMKELGLKVYPSEANFLLFEIDGADFHDEITSRGILIRSFSEPRLKGCYRVAIGTQLENQAFYTALKDYLRRDNSDKTDEANERDQH